jgi:hypothetical protein
MCARKRSSGGFAVDPAEARKVAPDVAERGVRVAIVRLPQVHDTRKQGLVPLLTQMAREKCVSALWATERIAIHLDVKPAIG